MNSSQKQSPSNDKKVSDVFNPRDFSIFKWTICRYMCESKDIMFSEQQIFLYLRENLRGYMHEDRIRDFLSGNSGNIYRRFLREVIQSLAQRDFVEIYRIPYPFGEFIAYMKRSKLEGHCTIFLKYLIGDIDRDLGNQNLGDKTRERYAQYIIKDSEDLFSQT
jgi:hypothetical protein